MVLGIKGSGINYLIAHCIGGSAVALNIAGIGLDVFVTNAEQGGPLGIKAGLKFTKQGGAVALAVVDVVEGAGPHAATRSRPPVVKLVGLILAADAEQIILVQINVSLEVETIGFALGVHRHAGSTGGADWRAGGAVGASRSGVVGARGGTIPEALVGTEIHHVVDLLGVGAGFQ